MSNLLLNIDHPDFNSKREELCNDIEDDVNIYESLPDDSPKRTTIRNRIIKRIDPKIRI